MALLKRLNMMNKSKKVNAIQTTGSSDLVKKADYKTKIGEVEKKMLDHDHDKYITTQEIKVTANNFAARLKQANLATKADSDDFVGKTDFDDKLKKLNKKLISDKIRHVEAEKKLTDLTKVAYGFLLGKIYFIGNNGYHIFLVFAPMLSSLTLDVNKKVTYWILTRVSSEKINHLILTLNQPCLI